MKKKKSIAILEAKIVKISEKINLISKQKSEKNKITELELIKLEYEDQLYDLTE